ncbi:MAG: 8-oxo-dGTP diphosphatase [Sulfuricurvum sp.]|uniref:NUDIX hydrolase n=1 Tax=Sulfuricurvum sp. TaxID=2025608 RepID=UPI002602EF6A|nr:8-oxo-dGTP diphosphatase [Sulfuricurvum sp.]MDD2785232.1 8-oxo-dGTP diphosphatase [Sulfuricurvum sp.]
MDSKTQEMYLPIIGTLGYILSPDGRETLLVHRNARNTDQHLGKYNGLGGKMLADEDVMTCMRREIYGESGLECTQIHLRGTINWTGFGPHGENWLGFIFLITAFNGIPKQSNEEGTLAWFLLSEMTDLPMWEGDRFFLPLVFDRDPRIFHGYMPYENGKPVSWSYCRL